MSAPPFYLFTLSRSDKSNKVECSIDHSIPQNVRGVVFGMLLRRPTLFWYIENCMKPRVYIETTIVGHLTSRLPNDLTVASQMLATRKWWKESRNQFDICTSSAVLNEVSRGDSEAASDRRAALREVRMLPISEAVIPLAELLLMRNALPAKARVDAVHLAIAATNVIQYLLTWNCRHLANATLRGKINEVCREYGYDAPIICTPFELAEVTL